MIEFINCLDEKILMLIQEYIRQPWADGFWKAVTHLGDFGWIWIITAVIFLLFKNTRKAGISALISLASGAVITNVFLKNIMERIRPYETIPDLLLLIEKQSDFSFPSGHTCASFAAATAFYIMLPGKWRMIPVILAVLIAFSRLYVGVHYLTDVLAGLLIGVLCGCLGCLIVRKVKR